jgi:hypothetical protein
MGGNGGGWYGGYTSNNTNVDREVSSAADSARYDAAANEYLQELLADYNSRDAEKIKTHIDTLQKAIERDIEGETETLFGGSVRKHTYVEGLSDIDVLVVVNNSSLADASAAQVLSYFEQRIAERLNGLGVKVKAGKLAITVSYSDGTEIQVLPAIKKANGIHIPSADGSKWSSVVRPQEFVKKLSSINQANGGKVVPIIKLFKGLQTHLPDSSQLKGYHIESLAIEAFRGYTGRQTPKDMLHHFVEYSSSRVNRPIADITGQSLHVDDYLGGANSQERQRVSGALNRFAKRLEASEKRGSIDDLKAILGEST